MTIYNMDETAVTTVQKKCQKVLGRKGKHQIGSVSSGERRTNTTGVCCCHAAVHSRESWLLHREHQATRKDPQNHLHARLNLEERRLDRKQQRHRMWTSLHGFAFSAECTQEDMIKCADCLRWVHDECAWTNANQIASVCDICQKNQRVLEWKAPSNFWRHIMQSG